MVILNKNYPYHLKNRQQYEQQEVGKYKKNKNVLLYDNQQNYIFIILLKY